MYVITKVEHLARKGSWESELCINCLIWNRQQCFKLWIIRLVQLIHGTFSPCSSFTIQFLVAINLFARSRRNKNLEQQFFYNSLLINQVACFIVPTSCFENQTNLLINNDFEFIIRTKEKVALFSLFLPFINFSPLIVLFSSVKMSYLAFPSFSRYVCWNIWSSPCFLSFK